MTKSLFSEKIQAACYRSRVEVVQRVKGVYYHPTRDFTGQRFSESIFGVDYESGC